VYLSQQLQVYYYRPACYRDVSICMCLHLPLTYMLSVPSPGCSFLARGLSAVQLTNPLIYSSLPAAPLLVHSYDLPRSFKHPAALYANVIFARSCSTVDCMLSSALLAEIMSTLQDSVRKLVYMLEWLLERCYYRALRVSRIHYSKQDSSIGEGLNRLTARRNVCCRSLRSNL
jgi:hypothetical protein